jgi:hypothetical protein
LHHNFKGFAPMTLKLWEKLRSGIVDMHPRRLQQPRQKHMPSFANKNDNRGRGPNTGRVQIPAPASRNFALAFPEILSDSSPDLYKVQCYLEK